MTKKKLFVDKLVAGTKLTEETFFVKITREGEERTEVLLSDRSGEVKGYISKNTGIDASAFTDSVCLVSGPILIDGGEIMVVIKDIKKCEEFNSGDLFNCLSDEKVQFYTALIRQAQNHVTHPGFKKLLECCLTEENLSIMAKRPASLSYYGVYGGGCLASTANVTHMVVTTAGLYMKDGNGINTDRIRWSVLITASLLHAFGCIDAYTDMPFKKTNKCILSGYNSVLQDKLTRIIYENGIELSDEDWDELKHILISSSFERTGVKSVSKEGSGLRHILALYAEWDALDRAGSEYTSEEDFAYMKGVNRYIMKRKEDEEDATRTA